RSWLERAVALKPQEDDLQRRLLAWLAVIAYDQGDHGVAVERADEAAALAMQVTGVADRYAAFRDRAFAAFAKGEWREADGLWAEAFAAAAEADNGVGMSSCRINRANAANLDERHEQAAAFLDENLPFVRSRGQTRCEATTLISRA